MCYQADVLPDPGVPAGHAGHQEPDRRLAGPLGHPGPAEHQPAQHQLPPHPPQVQWEGLRYVVKKHWRAPGGRGSVEGLRCTPPRNGFPVIMLVIAVTPSVLVLTFFYKILTIFRSLQ